MTECVVLALNAGSSSLKAALFAGGAELARETVELNGRDADGALDELFGRFQRESLPAPNAVGHRVVHGGPGHTRPVVVDDNVVAALRELAPLAPLHQAPGLAVLESARARYRDVPHVACFDTSFHRALPEVAQRFAIDERWWDAGVLRYGFHGLSYEYLLDAVPTARRGRVVLAHLGSGASMAALLDGAPRDTTMGLTPTGGLVMATRSGDLDPGVLLYLARTQATGRATITDVDALEHAVDMTGGLLGLSGTSADMRLLLTARPRDPRAAMAVAVFCHSARKHIGALAAVVGGLDLLVFTGGVGANSPEIRAEICAGLEHLGVTLDPAENQSGAECISASDAKCKVLVVPTDEELVIVRHVETVLSRP
ncbi:MAG: acetate/propionate family kinase [Actinomycetota bacterium]|nr:acetate/propionate family kinase [Actinomycetota bacterium]